MKMIGWLSPTVMLALAACGPPHHPTFEEAQAIFEQRGDQFSALQSRVQQCAPGRVSRHDLSIRAGATVRPLEIENQGVVCADGSNALLREIERALVNLDLEWAGYAPPDPDGERGAIVRFTLKASGLGVSGRITELVHYADAQAFQERTMGEPYGDFREESALTDAPYHWFWADAAT